MRYSSFTFPTILLRSFASFIGLIAYLLAKYIKTTVRNEIQVKIVNFTLKTIAVRIIFEDFTHL